jgi:baculoviral IAP repeat-containing protein 6
MLDILRLLGLHSALTDKTIFRKRTFKKDEVSMFALSYYGARKTTNETTSSIAECLMKLNVQSNMMLTGAKNNRSVFDTQQSKDMLWLCRQISDLAVFLLGKEKATAGITPNNQAVNVKETDDDKLLASHFFGQLAARIQNSAPGRMRKIISELTTLKTGLPPGIYIRYGMSRIDVMKVIIVGPEDTPYELGLFEFDILLPTEYPNKPPMVYFRGAAGTLLVSPNLHADGEGPSFPLPLPSPNLSH